MIEINELSNGIKWCLQETDINLKPLSMIYFGMF